MIMTMMQLCPHANKKQMGTQISLLIGIKQKIEVEKD